MRVLAMVGDPWIDPSLLLSPVLLHTATANGFQMVTSGVQSKALSDWLITSVEVSASPVPVPSPWDGGAETTVSSSEPALVPTAQLGPLQLSILVSPPSAWTRHCLLC